MNSDYQLIFAIVNIGYADSVMEVARECGASGGTIFNARGSAREGSEQMFGISISEEKEVVMIIVPTPIKNQILKDIYEKVGLKTPGSGICFSLDVEDSAGLSKQSLDQNKENKNVN